MPSGIADDHLAHGGGYGAEEEQSQPPTESVCLLSCFGISWQVKD